MSRSKRADRVNKRIGGKGVRTRRLSIRTKLLAVCSLAIVLAVGVMGYDLSARFKAQMIEMAVDQASVAAQVAADSIDVEALLQLEAGDEDTPEYAGIVKELREVKEICSIKFVYTLRTDGNAVYYGVDSDESENRCSIGEEFPVSYQELQGVFAGESYVQDYIDYTEDGELISAYVPLVDGTGKVVGILGSDFDASVVTRQYNSFIGRVGLIGGIIFAVSLVLIFWIIQTVVRGIRKVNGKLYELVHKEGDLTQTLDVRSGDEMEVMAGLVNELLAYIKEIMLHISKGSEDIKQSSDVIAERLASAGEGIVDVSATMQEMSAGMEETTASLNQITEAVQNMRTRIGNIAGKALDGDTLARDIQVRAKETYSMAQKEQVDARASAKEMERAVTEKIELSKTVKEINVLTENIIGITGQTNLLALNASIEAARAGEAGRGFAVVAGEIGKLASDSASAAGKIQSVSMEVVRAVEELATEAQRMIEFMEGTAMEGYHKLIDTCEEYQQNADSFRSIMEAFAGESEELDMASGEINESMSSINIAVEETAKGVMSVSQTTAELTGNICDIEQKAGFNQEIAENLAGQVAKFKLE